MIEIVYFTSRDKVQKLEVRGHAGFDDSGKDLICAGGSCIIFGLMNAIDNEDESAEIVQGDNEIVITLKDVDRAKVQDYLELTLIQLETIESSYPEFIKLERRKTL